MRAIPLLAAVVALSVSSSDIPDGFLKLFTCGKLYYRVMVLDDIKDTLYIGAMDAIYKIKTKDVNGSSCSSDVLALPAEDTTRCIDEGGSDDYECRNHIRALHPTHGQLIYVCGTNAQNPRDYLLDENLSDLSPYVESIGPGTGKCAIGPDDNVTSVWVEKGNPGYLPGLYAGMVLDRGRFDRAIVRSDLTDYRTMKKYFKYLRTVKYDSRWLDKPEFVGSFAIGEYVYFFFREYAVEYAGCGKQVLSRVARVCKQDLGAGERNPNRIWATYVKARLNCSMPGNIRFYFNEIQSVYFSEDEETFYAVFSTPTNGIYGSALCVFSLEQVDEAFSGTFMEQRNWDSKWKPVPWSKIPRPRPGICVNDTLKLPERMLLFHKTHTLMRTNIKAEGNRPVHIEQGVIFTSVLAYPRVRNDHEKFLIFYAGSADGFIYKIVQNKTKGKESDSYLANKWNVTDEPIRKLVISQKSEQLYAASDSGVTQINLLMCEALHKKEGPCKKDPYCIWSSQTEDKQECITIPK